jgi:hypothetical protein
MRRDVRKDAPIFVIGPSRPAVNVLTWSLGQHPNIAPVAESRWVGLFSAVLETVYGLATEERGRNQLDVMEISREDFQQRLGRTISEMLSAGPGRPGGANCWVAGSPEFSSYAYGLASLFPGARFIYVERQLEGAPGVDEGAASETDYQRSRRQWEEDTRACRDAQRAFGSQVVLQVNYADLIANSQACLRRCLAFLDEPYRAECLRPLQSCRPRATASKGEAPLEAAGAADRSGVVAGLRGDPQRLQALAEAFHRVGTQALVRVAQGTLAQGLQHAVEWVAPPEATVLVVSKGDDGLLDLPERRGWHFPQGKDGEYCGYYPATSAEAIAHLEELRSIGAGFFALPRPAFWWLDYYGGLRRHLASNYSMVWRDDRCIIYALTSEAGPAQYVHRSDDQRPLDDSPHGEVPELHSGFNAGPGVHSPCSPATSAEEHLR